MLPASREASPLPSGKKLAIGIAKESGDEMSCIAKESDNETTSTDSNTDDKTSDS